MTDRRYAIKYIDDEVSALFEVEQFNRTHWPYQHRISGVAACDNIDRWCWQHFKGRYWRSERGLYGFKREKDYQWFMLKWG
jgi:hypothetical protein